MGWNSTHEGSNKAKTGAVRKHDTTAYKNLALGDRQLLVIFIVLVTVGNSALQVVAAHPS